MAEPPYSHAPAKEPHSRSFTGANCRQAFSLIELIGVLAILVIIASLVIPRVIQSQKTTQAVQGISTARVQEVLTAIRAIQAAATAHRAQFGSLASRNGTALQVPGIYERYDSVLISEQLLDRPFSVRLGSAASVHLVNVSSRTGSPRAKAAAGFYDLDGRGRDSMAGAAYVLEAVISGLSEAEARALNDSLDGIGLGANPGEEDRRGKVIYGRNGSGELCEARIYITHQ